MHTGIRRVSAVIVALAVALAVTGCGQSSEEKASSTVQKALEDAGMQVPDTVSKETVKEWPAKFCSLTVGMTRDEAVAVMGKPTSSYNDSTANQDTWEGWGIDLTAFYDIDDHVNQLDDSTGEANLPCDKTRS